MSDALTLILAAPSAGPVLGLLAAAMILLLALVLAACLSRINDQADDHHQSADHLWDYDMLDHDRPARHRRPRP